MLSMIQVWLWLVLAALCGLMAISKAPPAQPKRQHYLVSYSFEAIDRTSGAGNCDMYLQVPLTAERVVQVREAIMELNREKNFKAVIIVSFTELD